MWLGHSVGAVVCPSTLANDPGLYAIRLGAKESFANVLPPSAVLVVSPTMPLREGDLAVLLKENQEIDIVKSHKDPVLGWQAYSFKTKEMHPVQDVTNIQRVVWIALM